MTYFLLFNAKAETDYLLCYKNLEIITQRLQNEGVTWTESDLSYFKKILLSYKGKFTYADFAKMARADISKQGALKILNRFVSYGLLKAAESNSKAKLFDLSPDCLAYAPENLRGSFDRDAE